MEILEPGLAPGRLVPLNHNAVKIGQEETGECTEGEKKRTKDRAQGNSHEPGAARRRAKPPARRKKEQEEVRSTAWQGERSVGA